MSEIRIDNSPEVVYNALINTRGIGRKTASFICIPSFANFTGFLIMKTVAYQARQKVGFNPRYNRTPVVVIKNSDAEPRLLGESWHYRTRGGRYIYHPSAYSRIGWSNMVYCSSTLRIEVGENWNSDI